jgi:hypothetical protein
MSTDDKHGALKARLEQIIKGYADSYRSMGNIGDGQVMCESVCFDLKNNVMKNVLEAADAFALSAIVAPTMIERAYCKANDYINALLTPSVNPESLKKIRADYLAAVRDVMTCHGCRDNEEGCPTPEECAKVRREYVSGERKG